MARYTGKFIVDISGIGILPTVGETEVTGAGFERTAVVGDSGVLGYSEKNTEAPMIKCKVRFSNTLKPSQLEAVQSATLTLQGDDGVGLVASGVFCAKTITYKAGEASDVEFHAVRLDEL